MSVVFADTLKTFADSTVAFGGTTLSGVIFADTEVFFGETDITFDGSDAEPAVSHSYLSSGGMVSNAVTQNGALLLSAGPAAKLWKFMGQITNVWLDANGGILATTEAPNARLRIGNFTCAIGTNNGRLCITTTATLKKYAYVGDTISNLILSADAATKGYIFVADAGAPITEIIMCNTRTGLRRTSTGALLVAGI